MLGSRKGRWSKSSGNSKLSSLGICIVAGELYAGNRGNGGLARLNRSNKRGSKYRCSLNRRGARGELDEIIKSFSPNFHPSC